MLNFKNNFCFKGNNGGRPKSYGQGHTYYPSVDYDARQSNPTNRQPNVRRQRRNAETISKYRNNYKNGRLRAARATNNNKLLGNNRFRNVTKNGGNQAKASFLDKMDAVSRF